MVTASPLVNLRRREVIDAAAVLALALIAQIETWWPTALDGPRPVGALGAVAMTVPLLWRRRAPLVVALVVMGALAAQSVAGVGMDDRLFVLVSVLMALYALGAHADRRAGWLGVAMAAVAIVAGEMGAGAGPPNLEDLFFVAVVVGGPGGFGRTVAGRQARADHFAAVAESLEEEGERETRRAVAEERERIAREIHDVVAHSVSLMLIQATGGRRRLRDGDTASAEGALESVETIGRQALAELRRAISLMRDHGDADGLGPQPGLSALPDLVERARATGVRVALDVRGAPLPLAPGLDLAAFRIIQEALTNVAKHAHGAAAEVALTFAPDDLEIIVDSGAGSTGLPATVPPGGNGLIGMRERVGAYGGRLDAGPLPGGGFRVRARLPIEGDAAA